MKARKRLSLVSKIICIILLLVLASTTIVGILTVRISDQAITGRLNENYSVKTDYLASKFDNLMLQYEIIVRDMAAMTGDISITNTTELHDLEDKFARLMEQDSSIISCYLGFDDTTYIDGSYWTPNSDWVCTARDWYTDAKAANGSIVYSKPYIDAESGAMCITISICAEAKDANGVAAIDIYIDSIFNSLDQIMTTYADEGDYLIITATDGDIISHKNNDFRPTSDDSFSNVYELMDGSYQKALIDDEVMTDYDGTPVYITGTDSVVTGFKVIYVSPSTHFDSVVGRIRSKTIFVIFICVLLAAGCAVFISLLIAKPIKKLSVELKSITDTISDGNGDLTKRIIIHTNDEISDVADGINAFIETLGTIIRKIKVTSEDITKASELIKHNIIESNNESMNISAIAEELSASMSVVSGSASGISTSTENVLSLAETLAVQATSGNDSVEEMQRRAKQVNALVVKKTAETKQMMVDKENEVSEAIKRSENVHEISSLVSEILGIASQTNLLALNASIEAARAGESGKGFAVVADEIRILADNSKTTADKIQVISTDVIEAVNRLIGSTRELLRTIEGMITEDYAKFSEMGNNYYEDAEQVRILLTTFVESTDQVKEAMNNVVHGVSDISGNIAECSNGINEVAESTTNLVEKMTQIQNDSQANEENMNTLNNETQNFKRL